MKVHCIGSESKGNLYLFVADNEDVLIVEAGISFSEVKKALGFDLSGIVGCIASHAHQDHSQYITQFTRAGIDVYCNMDTIEKMNLKGNHRVTMYNETIFQLGSFTIRPFPVRHTVPCYGFLIAHRESGKILFVTDAAWVPQTFTGLSHILIEANYSDEAMRNNHGLGAHMALDVCIDFIKANSSADLRNVVLLHLSATNSDERKFVDAVKAITPHADVVAADKGVTVNLNKLPF